MKLKRFVRKLSRAPEVIEMLIKIEWAQLITRGIPGYVRFRAKNFRNHLSDKYPQALQIEPFGGCNLRCKMCFQGRMKLPADNIMMDISLYQRIVDQMSPFTPMLYLYWRGEPLLHKELDSMIRYAKNQGMYVFVSTNAVTLTELQSEALIDAGLDFLMIGFDGASQDTYSQMRSETDFDKLCARIQTMVRLKHYHRSLLPHICLQFIVSEVNVHELPLARKLAYQLGADSFLEKSLDVYTNFQDGNIDKALQQLFVENAISKYTQDNNELHFSGPPKCEMATRMVIRADGEVSLCCYDMQGQYTVGSAKDRDLMELWRSDQYVRLREKGQNRQLPLCSNCGAGVQK